MMGHREVLSGGNEYDVFSRRCRRILAMRASTIASVKASFNRRIRRAQKIMVRLSKEHDTV